MPLRKKQSKRMTLHHKHKVEKKVREHNRKVRKETRKNPKRKKMEELSVPNSHPMKAQIIREAEEMKAKQKAMREEMRHKRHEELAKRRGFGDMEKDASKRAREFEKRSAGDDDECPTLVADNSKRAYFKEFRKVVEVADVILEVLDARDPLGCRSKDIEQYILQRDPNKRIILVLNKIDLVPKDVVEKWLKYLRNEFPTIAFKSSTQTQRKNLGHSKANIFNASSSLIQSSECLGAENLLSLLKNYARNRNIKTAIRVGIIGYPNVGKSSLINSLKRARVVGVGSTPGFTKVAQEVSLDKNIKLIDSPGIVFGSTDGQVDNDIVLRNCVRIEQLDDVIEPVQNILKRCTKEQLMLIYQMPNFDDLNGFLLNMANKIGKLRRGGLVDLQAAARTVLQDWMDGKIPFYTIPPELAQGIHVGASVVQEWGKEFSIEDVMDNEKQVISGMSQSVDPGLYTALPASQMGSFDSALLQDEPENDDDYEDVDDEDLVSDDDEEEEEEPMKTEIAIPTAPSKGNKVTKVQAILSPDEMVEANKTVNKDQKKDSKKAKKEQRKAQRKEQGGTFSFKTDFQTSTEMGRRLPTDDALLDD
eukprot:TRINITY_DN457_c0_g3_i1.p1 TRINITY_DN457_c0_g3~~TRINITY_DN457_c0_g3_i1.p1  ORF type:complete len:590 (-),score=173.27 TRINITY_DN457_c0_g3_i1:73-1842(-)